MKQLDDYARSYGFLRMSRADGILEMQFQSADGGSFQWDQFVHQELPMALADIGADPSTRLIIMTGSGDEFMKSRGSQERPPLGEGVPPTGWSHHDRMSWEGERILRNLLDLEVPIIAAVNGPAHIHAEIALLSDIVLASETAVFSDRAHFPSGLIPGDGAQIIWQMLLGPNRGRHFLLTGRQLSAVEALDLGVVAEVLPPRLLMDRARNLAKELNEASRLTLRYTRNVLTRPLKKALNEELAYSMALEGIAIAAMKSEQRLHE